MEERLTKSQAIRAYCIDCCCGNKNEVRLCPLKTCSLLRYRMGHEEKDELYHPKHRNLKSGSVFAKSDHN